MFLRRTSTQLPATEHRSLLATRSTDIPDVIDQMAMARPPRATYALFLALLPATATVIGVIVLRQFPSVLDLVGIALVVLGVALHRTDARRAGSALTSSRSVAN